MKKETCRIGIQTEKMIYRKTLLYIYNKQNIEFIPTLHPVLKVFFSAG